MYDVVFYLLALWLTGKERIMSHGLESCGRRLRRRVEGLAG